MRLSSMADYAVVIMVAAARHGVVVCADEAEPAGGSCQPHDGARARVAANAARIAEETRLPLPTVQKLVSRLVAAGLLSSLRGAGGGLALARGVEAISLAEIVEAVEGPIVLTACADEARHDCAMEAGCAVRPHWVDINATLRGTLAGVPLSQLIGAAAGRSGVAGQAVVEAG